LAVVAAQLRQAARVQPMMWQPSQLPSRLVRRPSVFHLRARCDDLSTA